MVTNNTPVSGNDTATAIIGFAMTAATVANKLQIGSTLLQGVIGFTSYTRFMAVSPLKGAFAQYVCATMASNMAADLAAATVFGVSAGAVANVAFAVITAVTIAQIAQFGYNHIMADKSVEKKPVQVSPFSILRAAVSIA
jgi:hypothetical protein